nr:hypothetical protein [Micromonospora acroterricola]
MVVPTEHVNVNVDSLIPPGFRTASTTSIRPDVPGLLRRCGTRPPPDPK